MAVRTNVLHSLTSTCPQTAIVHSSTLCKSSESSKMQALRKIPAFWKRHQIKQSLVLQAYVPLIKAHVLCEKSR